MSYLRDNVSILIPTGGIVAYVGVIGGTNNTPPPEGWFLCDGTGYSSSEYPKLFNVIGTNYGTGNGTTTNFNVPNFQAAFLRGARTQTYPISGGTTYGYTTGTTARTINTAQSTSTQTHTHTINLSQHSHTISNDSHGHDVSDSGHTHPIRSTSGNIPYYEVGGSSLSNFQALGNPGPSQVPGFNDSKSLLGPVNSNTCNNVNTSSNSASIAVSIGNNTTNPNPRETAPFNYAINWIITYL